MLLSGLFDIVLACAPIAAVAPAVAAVVTGHATFGSQSHVQRRLYRSLLVAEKLPATTPGSAQISAGIDRDTLRLAYLTQYPQRATEIAHLGLIALGLFAVLVVYYAMVWADGWWLYLLILLAVVVIAAGWQHRAIVNFIRNDTLTRELFGHFGAPAGLTRPHSELIARTPALTASVVLARAADVRDAEYRTALTSLDAVNAVLTATHPRVHWQTHLRGATRRVTGTDYRSHAKIASAHTLSFAHRSYDWLLRQLIGPFFTMRLSYLQARERSRVSGAEKAGDVYKAAWLTAHYRNERSRLDRHLLWLHAAREQSVRSRRPLHSERDRTGFVDGVASQ